MLRRHPRRNPQVPRVVERRGVRADRVGQPATLAHFEEQAAAHPPPQHLVEQRQRVAIRIEPRPAAQRQRQIALLDRPLLHADRILRQRPLGRRARRAGLARLRRPVLLRQPHHLVHAHIPRHREHDVLRPVPALNVLGEMLARNRPNRLQIPRDLPGQRLLAVRRRADQLPRPLRRLVVRPPNLRADHRALPLDLALLQQRMLHAVGQHIHRQRQPVVGHAIPERRQLPCGVRIQRSARALDCRRNSRRLRPPLRALEQHVLEIVRKPQRAPRLVAAAHPHVGRQRRRLRVRHRRHRDPQPVAQLVDGRLRRRGGLR